MLLPPTLAIGFMINTSSQSASLSSNYRVPSLQKRWFSPAENTKACAGGEVLLSRSQCSWRRETEKGKSSNEPWWLKYRSRQKEKIPLILRFKQQILATIHTSIFIHFRIKPASTCVSACCSRCAWTVNLVPVHFNLPGCLCLLWCAVVCDIL